jgi:hypothetical protein
MSIDPERLMAYVDGQTNGEETARIEAAIAADPRLRAQAEGWRAQNQALRTAFDPILHEPIPQRLQEAMEPKAQILAFRPRHRDWRALSAGLIGLAAAALLGFQLGAGPGNGLLRTDDGGVWAKGALAHALERQASGEPGQSQVAIALTVQGQNDAPCRAFRVHSQGLDGLACRQEQGWSVVALGTQAIGEEGAYRPAAGLSPGVLAALEGIEGAEALSPEAEAARIRAQWR